MKKTLETVHDYIEGICEYHGVTFMGVFGIEIEEKEKYRDFNKVKTSTMEVLTKGKVSEGLLKDMIERNESLIDTLESRL